MGLRMADTPANLTGAHSSLVPALLECLWLTMRDNNTSFPDVQGNTPQVRQYVSDNFAISSKRNPWLARSLNRRLRARYSYLTGLETWVPKAFYTIQ